MNSVHNTFVFTEENEGIGKYETTKLENERVLEMEAKNNRSHCSHMT